MSGISLRWSQHGSASRWETAVLRLTRWTRRWHRAELDPPNYMRSALGRCSSRATWRPRVTRRAALSILTPLMEWATCISVPSPRPAEILVKAGRLYATGCTRLVPNLVSTLGRGATFIRRTGLLNLTCAARLASLADVDGALGAFREALAAGIAGDDSYPGAYVWELRTELLAMLGEPIADIGRASFEAGKRHLSNHNLKRAVSNFRIAASARPPIPEAGWQLAEALRRSAHQSIDGAADARLLRQAQDEWQEWRKLGAPDRASSWAYVSRALIALSLAEAQRADPGPASWEAVFLSEKALVVDRQNTFAWRISLQSLRALKLFRLALESADSGLALSPEEIYLRRMRILLLADTGQLDEAVELLEGIPDTEEWEEYSHSELRASSYFRTGHAKEALACVEPLVVRQQPSRWLLYLRAECHASLGRLDEAIDDVRRMLDIREDPTIYDQLLEAWAYAVLGNLDAATYRLDALSRYEETVNGDLRIAAAASCAAARGDMSAVARVVGEAIAARDNEFDVAEIARTIRITAALHAHACHAPAVAKDVLQQVASALARWRLPPTGPGAAERELTGAVEKHQEDQPGSLARLALAAMSARRLGSSGKLDDAANAYAGLQSTDFEPEATIALCATLGESLDVAIARGEVREASELFERLHELNHAPVPFVELVIADAHAAAGRLAEAIALVAGVAPKAVSPSDRLAVYEQLGDCAFRGGQTGLAATSFTKAAEAAKQLSDVTRSAQLHARLAAVSAVGGEGAAVSRHITEALNQLQKDGAADASVTLHAEISRLGQSLRPDARSALWQGYNAATKADSESSDVTSPDND